MTLLSIRALGHAFGQRSVLESVDLDVAEGERVAILGPSGCGKTTLLALMAGLMPVQRGAVLSRGAVPVAGRDSAVIFQTPRLLPWRRVGDNVALVLRGMPKDRRAARVADLLGRMGLGDRAKDWPTHLSGGQQQRVALARALAMDVPLLLLDEPFASLDPLSREGLQAELLRQAEGRTLVIVTHSVEEALVLGDRILLMRAGGAMNEIIPGLVGHGDEKRRDPRFFPALAALSENLRAAAR